MKIISYFGLILHAKSILFDSVREEIDGEERILTPDIISEEPSEQPNISDYMALDALLEAFRLEYSLIKGEILIARHRIRNCLREIWETNRDPRVFVDHPQVRMVEEAYGLRGLYRILGKKGVQDGIRLLRLRWKGITPGGFFGERRKHLAELRRKIEETEAALAAVEAKLPPSAVDFF